MRTLYHEFESLEHLLATRLLPGGGGRADPLRRLRRHRRGRRRLGDRALPHDPDVEEPAPNGRSGARSTPPGCADKDDRPVRQPPLPGPRRRASRSRRSSRRRHYRIDDRIDLKFSLLRLQVPADLEDHVRRTRAGSSSDYDLETGARRLLRRPGLPLPAFRRGARLRPPARGAGGDPAAQRRHLHPRRDRAPADRARLRPRRPAAGQDELSQDLHPRPGGHPAAPRPHVVDRPHHRRRRHVPGRRRDGRDPPRLRPQRPAARGWSTRSTSPTS